MRDTKATLIVDAQRRSGHHRSHHEIRRTLAVYGPNKQWFRNAAMASNNANTPINVWKHPSIVRAGMISPFFFVVNL